MRVYGIPDVLNAINILTTDNKSRYDALTVLVPAPDAACDASRRTTRVAGAYAYGGSDRATARAPRSRRISSISSPKGEWGPTGNDETSPRRGDGRRSICRTAFSCRPCYQAASARPYTLTAGQDLNRDGTNNDRYIDPATGKQVAVNSQRGDPTQRVRSADDEVLLAVGRIGKSACFAEAFNLFNTANFGNSYTGNGRSATFRQPTGFVVPASGCARAAPARRAIPVLSGCR